MDPRLATLAGARAVLGAAHDLQCQIGRGGAGLGHENRLGLVTITHRALGQVRWRLGHRQRAFTGPLGQVPDWRQARRRSGHVAAGHAPPGLGIEHGETVLKMGVPNVPDPNGCINAICLSADLE